MSMRKVFFLLCFMLIWGRAHAGDALPPVTVFVPKVCLACLEWAEHLRQHGFTVKVDDSQDMAKIKQRYRITPDLESRLTAVVGSYVIEGHVPAEDIKQLLIEKPKARGLAVPGSPRGAPGLDVLAGTGCETGCTILEGDGAANRVRRELYNTLLVGNKGDTSTFARH